MDLLDYMRENNMTKEEPLASRMRPKTLDEVMGQKHIIGKDKLLYRAIKADKLSSIIFYGPPGTGKTTLAKVIANTTSASFRQINATVAGKKDMEDVVNGAKDIVASMGSSTICTTQMEPKIMEIPLLGVLGYLAAMVLCSKLLWSIIKTDRRK